MALIVLLVGQVSATQIDESTRILSAIKRSAANGDSTYLKMSALMDRVDTWTVAKADDVFKSLIQDAKSLGNEEVSFCASIFISVYYINHNSYSKALSMLSMAENYSHLQRQRNYVDYLKSTCYLKQKREDLIAPTLENLMAHRPEESDFSAVLYSESLRLMSLYYQANGNDELAYRFISAYCNMTDTLNVATVPAYCYIVPNSLRNKYIDHRPMVVDNADHKAGEAESPASTATIPIIISIISSLGFLGLGFQLMASQMKLKAARHEIQNVDPTMLAFAPMAKLLSSSSSSVSIVNTDGTLHWVNNGFQKLYGYSKEEFILTFGDNAFQFSNFEGRCEAFGRCMDLKKSQEVVSRVRTGHNTEIWIQSTITPVMENGDIIRYVVVDVDVSQIMNQTKAIGLVNSQLKASLRNASEIQKLLMPSRQSINEAFNNFLIYKPKDLVSGDFYWYRKIGESYYFALGDCTGHGPSASLLSVLSSKSLDNIIVSRNILDPKEILNSLDEAIIATLRKKDDNNCDGLDITICKITPGDGQNVHLTIAGAQSYFIYYTDGQTNLLKGCKRSIGGIIQFQMNHKFENTDLELKHGDRIFMTSDGVIDQNNIMRRSLGSRRFCDIIQQSSSLPIYDQQDYIENAVKEWAQGQPQRDDICVLGIVL